MIFENKVNALVPKGNQFVKAGLKVSAETSSHEGAKKYKTSGNEFVDDFASAALYKNPRTYAEVDKTMRLLWSINPRMCLKMAVYIRLITRRPDTPFSDESLDTIQKGQGLKNEGILRMIWIAINHPKTFKANAYWFIAAGSWKDIFEVLSLDLQYHGWKGRKLDWNFLYSVIQAGIQNKNTTHLVRKYLPTIRTNKESKTLESQAHTTIGRWLALRLFLILDDKVGAYKSYRHLKAGGWVHKWQQQISKQLYEAINFDHIAGRALAQLVGSKFLENHHLVDKYKQWIKSKPVAKFTGYVYELFKPYNDYSPYHIEDYKEDTINAQFMKLVEDANIESPLLVVRDTSGSMTSQAIGANITSNCIAKSMALYFSYFLKGVFSNCWAEFSDGCTLHIWRGETPVDKYINDTSEAYGGTNFQSVIDLFINLFNQGTPEEDFPKGILCLSDGEFRGSNTETNFQKAINRLRQAGFSKEYVDNFKIILWDIPNGYYGNPRVQFEDFADAPNFFYISGFDGSVISFIFGGDKPELKAPKTAKELMEAALNQDLLNRLTVVS